MSHVNHPSVFLHSQRMRTEELVERRLILTATCLVIFFPLLTQAGDGKPWDPALGTATISGSVKFDGKQPRSRPIDMAGADEKCAELHGGVRQKPDTVIVNDNGTLRNVFVWVKSGAEGWDFPMPAGEIGRAHV